MNFLKRDPKQLPSRELTYPLPRHDFPFPKVGYVSSLEGIQRSSIGHNEKEKIWMFSEFEVNNMTQTCELATCAFIYKQELPKQELFGSHVAVLKLSGVGTSKHNILFWHCLYPKPSCHTSWRVFRMALGRSYRTLGINEFQEYLCNYFILFYISDT